MNSSSHRPSSPAAPFFEALASLRLTVALFAMAIVLIFVGTLAQVDHDIWYVVEEGYFRVWFAWFELQAFDRLVKMFTKAEPLPVEGGFWFPGGKLIGVLMMANLLAAHSIRFKVSAKGARLARGLALVAAGAVATLLVVRSGLDDAIESQLSPTLCDTLWQTLRAGVVALGLAGAWWSVSSRDRLRPAEWWLATTVVATLLAVGGWLLLNPAARIDDAGLRIVWQLAKGGAAAGVLLWGCALAFGKRAGVVLLHAGIGLLMVGELITDLTAEEAQMRIPEGETVSYAEDIRETELAISTPTDVGLRVTVVPEWMLSEHARTGELIKHPDLPFDMRVVRFDLNSTLTEAGVSDNLATKGAGESRISRALPSVVGVGTEQSVNLPSAYIEPIDRLTGDSLGVWLVSSSFFRTERGSLRLLPQSIEHDGEVHEVDLRFQRIYKPYSLTLTDFRFDRYIGTNVAKNFSSDVVLRDPSRGVEREVRVWMNNPLRYAGDTIYQSSFDEVTEALTVLQVVTNGGWMIPYVSCMLVGLGMLAHFGVALARFTSRRSREAAKTQPPAEAGGRFEPGSPLVWAPALAALLCGGYLLSKARPANDAVRGFQVERFASLPIAHGGRIKPVDTLARNTLQFLSARQEVETDGAPLSAAEWLLDVVADRPVARDHRVFRIENLEVLELLDLPRRPGSFRYSHREIVPDSAKAMALDEQFRRIRRTPEEERTLVQAKLAQLDNKLNLYASLRAAYGPPQIGFERDKVQQQVLEARRQADFLAGSRAPKAVPPDGPDGKWQTLFEAELDDLFRRVRDETPNDATVALSGVIDAYAKDNARDFNTRLAKFEGVASGYEAGLDAEALAELAPAERLSMAKVSFEHAFNAASPFYYSAATYLIAFLLTAASWLAPAAMARPLARGATAVIVVTLVMHTLALVARVYISGRPPVTNLYSSAVFIGWAAVLLGVAMESIYRLGVGNAVASALGFATLVVAHFLSLDGDTFTVLQAVLDTQFWLATHVVCVTLGYSATFLAGFLAITYLFATQIPRAFRANDLLADDAAKQLTRMTYGTVCFGLFFSFIGTVLGGLWADDSWGRFWGWDPKENGALIIVLWNALVLHARWGKLVGPQGLATLVVGGNIVTCWSWFGVNEMGVGLHAYGANDSPTAFYLLVFVASQLAVILLGMLAIEKRTA